MSQTILTLRTSGSYVADGSNIDPWLPTYKPYPAGPQWMNRINVSNGDTDYLFAPYENPYANGSFSGFRTICKVAPLSGGTSQIVEGTLHTTPNASYITEEESVTLSGFTWTPTALVWSSFGCKAQYTDGSSGAVRFHIDQDDIFAADFYNQELDVIIDDVAIGITIRKENNDATKYFRWTYMYVRVTWHCDTGM